MTQVKHSITIIAIVLTGVVAGLLTSGQITFAQDTAYRIGIVDVQAVMDKYEKRDSEVATLEAQAKKSQDSLDAMEEQFKKKRDDFRTLRESLTPEELESRKDELANTAQELDRLLTELRAEYQKAEADLNSAKLRVKERLLSDILDAIEQVANSGNYHLVLESEKTGKTGVLYFAQPLDITQQVVSQVNKM